MKLIHVRDAKPHTRPISPTPRETFGANIVKRVRTSRDRLLCVHYGKIVSLPKFWHFLPLYERRPWKIIPANCRYASQTQGFSIGGKIPLFTLDLSRCAINSICYASILALSGIKHQRRCAQQTKQIKTYSFDAVLIAARTKNPVLMATRKVHGARPHSCN